MQRFSHDQILDEIHILFDWNPPTPSPDLSNFPRLIVPPCFYYDHLDDKLSLKEIAPLTTLIPNLSATVDRVLESIKDRKITLPPVLIGDMFPSTEYRKARVYDDPITDAYSVSEAYERTAHHCALIASMLFLSPSSPSWRSLIKWDEVELGAGANPGLDETHVLCMKEHISNDGINDHTWNSVEGETYSILRRIGRQSPTLALWEIFSITPDSEELLKNLGETRTLLGKTIMEDTTPETDLLQKQKPDALELPWGAPMSSLSGKVLSAVSPGVSSAGVSKDLPRRSSRLPKGTVIKSSTNLPHSRLTRDNGCFDQHTRTVTLPKRTEPKVESLSGIMLKHAWLRAVHKDSTYILFHCGTLERIMFRHRGSQTLYISGLVQVSDCKNPGYGKLHIGLYMSIVHDALDRMQQLPVENSAVQENRRRRNKSVPSRKLRHPRTRGRIAKLEISEMEHEKACDYLTGDATRSELLLLRMCYGVYNSPSPSFFLRSGGTSRSKKDFGPHEYLSVTLESDIAAGATGIVHGATLRFISAGGKLSSMSVVVKFSMKPKQQKSLRYEYSIYEKLALSHVKGVPRAIGLFEDLGNDVLALVMTHTGTCLSNLYPETRFVVEEPQRSHFIRVMSDIHAAGIRHRDIRPENLTVDDEGRVFIIDFDMAEISPTEGAKSREIAHLIELLDGRYLPPNEFPSERTIPRSNGRSGSGSRSRSENGSGMSSSSRSSSQSSTEEE